jgi:hypothetical protein
MEALDAQEIVLAGDDQAGGQHGDPIVQAFAIPPDDLPLGAIEVFDAQPQTLHEPHARAIEYLGHQGMGPERAPMTCRTSAVVRTVGRRVGLWARMASMGPSSGCLNTSRERNSRALRAWFGGGSDLLLHREVGQTRLDVRGSHLLGMARVVEEHAPFDPAEVTQFPKPLQSWEGMVASLETELPLELVDTEAADHSVPAPAHRKRLSSR